MYGSHGAGIAERDGQSQRLTVIRVRWAKPSVGGRLYRRIGPYDRWYAHCARFIFTTALPRNCCVAIASISHHLMKPGQDTGHPAGEGKQQSGVCRQALPVLQGGQYIDACYRWRSGAARLRIYCSRHSVYVQPINCPTVAARQRLRIAKPTAYRRIGRCAGAWTFQRSSASER